MRAILSLHYVRMLCEMNGYNAVAAPKNVVIYARVSTEHEAQLSALGNQLDWYKPLLEQHPEWTLVHSYVDEGITGTSAKKRPQFMKMLEDAQSGELQLILTREVSRFARNTVDTLQYTRRLKAMGVEVFFINDNIRTFDTEIESKVHTLQLQINLQLLTGNQKH